MTLYSEITVYGDKSVADVASAASEAASEASEASATATAAQTAAGVAQTAAEGAQSAAESAASQAASAATAAGTAATAAESAQTAAESAQSEASASATSAESAASSASASATAATTAATNAQTAATAAGQAETKAQTAKETAEAADAKADEAQSTAESAQSTAEAAQAAADDAAKTATNYLSSDSTGVMVADLTGSQETPSTATGSNALIDSDGFYVRDGQTKLASFTADGLEIKDPTETSPVGIASFKMVDMGEGGRTPQIALGEGYAYLDPTGLNLYAGTTQASPSASYRPNSAILFGSDGKDVILQPGAGASSKIPNLEILNDGAWTDLATWIAGLLTPSSSSFTIDTTSVAQNDATYASALWKIGRLVICRLSVKTKSGVTLNTNTQYQVGTGIPSAYRPLAGVEAAAVWSTGAYCRFRVTTGGIVYIHNLSAQIAHSSSTTRYLNYMTCWVSAS